MANDILMRELKTAMELVPSRMNAAATKILEDSIHSMKELRESKCSRIDALVDMLSNDIDSINLLYRTFSDAGFTFIGESTDLLRAEIHDMSGNKATFKNIETGEIVPITETDEGCKYAVCKAMAIQVRSLVKFITTEYEYPPSDDEMEQWNKLDVSLWEPEEVPEEDTKFCLNDLGAIRRKPILE